MNSIRRGKGESHAGSDAQGSEFQYKESARFYQSFSEQEKNSNSRAKDSTSQRYYDSNKKSPRYGLPGQEEENSVYMDTHPSKDHDDKTNTRVTGGKDCTVPMQYSDTISNPLIDDYKNFQRNYNVDGKKSRGRRDRGDGRELESEGDLSGTPHLTILNKIEEEIGSLVFYLNNKNRPEEKNGGTRKGSIYVGTYPNTNPDTNHNTINFDLKESKGSYNNFRFESLKPSSQNLPTSSPRDAPNPHAPPPLLPTAQNFQNHLVYHPKTPLAPFEFSLGLDFIPNKILPSEITPYDLSNPNPSSSNRNIGDYDGIIIDPYGYYYIGQVNSNNEKHGKGIYHWPDGMKFYEGEYYGGLMQGWGIFYRRNGGLLYEGNVYNNWYNGYGVLFGEGGEEVSRGAWRNGVFKGSDDVSKEERMVIKRFLDKDGGKQRGLVSERELSLKLLAWKNRVNNGKGGKGSRAGDLSEGSERGGKVITEEIVKKFMNEYLYRYYNSREAKKAINRHYSDRIRKNTRSSGRGFGKKNEIVKIYETQGDCTGPETSLGKAKDVKEAEVKIGDLIKLVSSEDH